MVGIAGLLAKRKQAGGGAAASQPSIDTTTISPPHQETCVGPASPVKDTHPMDPFTFDERPGTSGSYSFSVGAYMDTDVFDTYDHCDRELATVAQSPPKSIGGLFRRATKESRLTLNSASASPLDEMSEVRVASIVLPCPHDKASVAFGKDMETFSMPPPPPRTIAVQENMNAHSRPHQRLEEDTVMTRSTTSIHDIQQHPAVDDRIIQDNVEASTKTVHNDDIIERHMVSANAVCPLLILETPAKGSSSRELTKAESAAGIDFTSISVEHWLPAVTPPSRVLENDVETRAVDMSSFVKVSSDQPHYDRIVREECFDEMHIRFLHDSQDVKDKHLNSEEQILEMEVYLDHVIAMINADILQMQEMHDDLNEVEEAHEAILAMCRE